MLLLIDTCFWNHCIELTNENIWDFRVILSRFRWGYTKAILDEIYHYELDNYIPIDQALIVPVVAEEIKKFCKIDPVLGEFDLADQTLVVAGKREHALALTDDTPLELECIGLEISVLRLPAFMLRLIDDELVEKRDFSRSMRCWEEKGRYRKIDLKRWMKKFQSLK